VQLDNEFTVSVPIEQAWRVLTDLELIAPCMPGAQLTGVSDGVYTGRVKVKVGPVTAEYAGTAQFTEKDDGAYHAVIDARGRDSRGQGNASALISAQLQPEGSSTVVTVHTDMSIAGRLAQFGSGMIKEVSAKLLTQFVQCLEQKLNDSVPAGLTQSAAPAADAAGGGAAAANGSGPAGATAAGTAGAPAQETGQPPAAGAAASAPARPEEPAPLNLMTVAGGAVSKRVLPVFVAIVTIVIIVVLLLH